MIVDVERTRHEAAYAAVRRQSCARPTSAAPGPARERQIARLLELVASIQSARQRGA